MSLFRLQITLSGDDAGKLERLRTVLEGCRAVGSTMTSESPVDSLVFYTEAADSETNVSQFYTDLIHTAVDEDATVEILEMGLEQGAA
ncbi:hypothetical protein [Granulicella tundricola]|uniref:Uncharacterized protein n=1 Tax=Granulicella tundricola (strain ATCC BAA-1859 / DSM 23138 / MP5ACTX9) TaxID=1198114 RepID=E8WYG8_GRATM|nr:hypothetical protein [Granulicella tundricola]ADW69874.1 hypothetical protein AciX9_2851 [Granulicella tundricola MP5ACTX9]